MKITLEQLIAFYNEKSVSASCNVCGKDKWTLLEAPDEYSFAIGSTRTDGGLTVPFPTVPVVTLMCENCYNLRIHAAHPIADASKKK